MREFKPMIMRTAGLRFAPSPMLATRAADDRVIDFVFSDESVARDGHTISTAGWELSAFLANPIFLWCHDANSPPIGRVVRIGPDGDKLTGSVQFASRDQYAFADTVFSLFKAGYLNASSVSWNPLDWRHTTDKRRPGGIDFLRQELLEVSAVPVPALATALVTARAAGIDTKPLFDWADRALDMGGFAVLPRSELETLRREAKMPAAMRAKKAADWEVGAARDLPISDKDGWDGPAASSRMLDAATTDDKIDAAKAKRGFLLYDAANPDLKGSYKEPFADIIDGKLTAVAGGVRAAASRLPQVDGASQEAKDEARKVLDAYEAKLKDDRTAPKFTKRSLHHVGWLAMLLDDLGSLQDCTEWEAAIEEDGSPVPGQLLDALKSLGAVLVAMTAEEVGELLAGDDDEDDFGGGVIAYASDLDLKRAAFRALRRLPTRALTALNQAMRMQINGRAVTFTDGGPALPLLRAGKVLSADTKRCMRDALAMHAEGAAQHERACGMVRDLLDDNCDDPDDPNCDCDPEVDDDCERALRARKAAARRKKLAIAPA